MLTRRTILAGALAASVGSRVSAEPTTDLGLDRIVLLGTKGGPAIRGYAPSPSANLLVWKDVPYIVDSGYGITFKLVAAGFPLTSLRDIFVTHRHSDHTLELGTLAYNAWAIGLNTQVDVWGPEGIEENLGGFFASQRFDIETRMADEGRPDLRKLVVPHTVREGTVLERGGVRVRALRVKHPPITESYAYRFDLDADTSVVFSGDTAYFPPLAEFARGADILVHEVAYGPALDALAARNPNARTLVEHLRASHTMAEDVGRIAEAAGVKKLVLNHFVPADDRSLTDDVWAEAVAKTYSGQIIVGRDGVEIPLL